MDSGIIFRDGGARISWHVWRYQMVIASNEHLNYKYLNEMKPMLSGSPGVAGSSPPKSAHQMGMMKLAKSLR
jgi:hypothetical protein